MRRQLTTGFLMALVLAGTYGGYAQRTSGRESGSGRDSSSGRGSSRSGVSSANGVINYQDTSQRNTQRTDRDDRKKKAEEDAKKKAEEEKRKAERDKRNGTEQGKAAGMVTTRGGSGTTSGSRNMARPATGKPGSGPATKPVNAGGSTDPTTQDVTAVMLQAVRTQTVDFNPADAKNEPGMLLLNAPKFDGTKRTRAGDTGGDATIAQPL